MIKPIKGEAMTAPTTAECEALAERADAASKDERLSDSMTYRCLATALRAVADERDTLQSAREVQDAALMNLRNDLRELAIARDAEVESLRGLLREARHRTQNLLNRQHGDQVIMNPDEYLRATLAWLDAAIGRDAT